MTTIIITKNAVAFDHQSTCAGGRIERLVKQKKVVTTKDRDGRDCLAGAAGDSELCCMFIDWVGDSRVQMPSAQELNDCDEYFHGFIFYPDTEELYTYGPRLYPNEEDLPFAMGSGAVYALSALQAGCTIEKACEVAGSMDAYTSTDFTIIKFKKPRVKKNVK